MIAVGTAFFKTNEGWRTTMAYYWTVMKSIMGTHQMGSQPTKVVENSMLFSYII